MDIAIVLHPDLHLAVQSGIGNPLPGQCRLFVGNGDPHRHRSVVPGGVQHHAAPAAANIEQALAGLQAQLVADEFVLGRLGVFQRGGVVGEYRTRVRHRRPQNETVEVVGDVVVVAYGVGVTSL